MRVTVGAEILTLSDYKATYLNHTYIPGALEVKDFWADKSLTPLYIESRNKHDGLKVQLMFKDAGLGDISTLREKLKRCEIQIDHGFPGDRVFDCILRDSILKKESRNIHTVVYVFDCLIFGAIHEFTASGDAVFIHGAKETEAVITIANNTATVITEAGIAINDASFVIRDLAANENIIIDGVKKIVTAGGENAFDRVEFFNFPQLRPGTNSIIATNSADITIRYRERW